MDNAVMALADMGFIDTFAGRGARDVGQPTDPAFDLGSDLIPWGRHSTAVPAFPEWNTFTFNQVLQPGKGVISADVNLILLLQMLVKNRNARVVAHPQVTVNNNEEGEIFVGESVPFETGQVTSSEARASQTTVEYREVGTRLTIRPQINKEGRVVLRIAIENSRRKPEFVNGRIITQRQTYDTKMTVENQQTVWLGGLREEREDNTVRKFPILGSIPVVGYLFRKTDKATLDSILYTFVKPQVMESAMDAEIQYRKARDDIRGYKEEFKQLEQLLPYDDDPTSPASGLPEPGEPETGEYEPPSRISVEGE
jgi:type II secretory pathway component GspD/PulD (secretin)